MPSPNTLIQKAFFRTEERLNLGVLSFLRKTYFSLRGLTIGKSALPPCYFTWPHQVTIGDHCILEHNIYFKHDGIWSAGKSIVINDRVFIGLGCEFNIRKRITIGENTLIASGCKFVDHDNGFEDLSVPINQQLGLEAEITIGENVWIGANSINLKGVSIGGGAIVAAGSIVTESIGTNEIWAGVPAKRIKDRKPLHAS